MSESIKGAVKLIEQGHVRIGPELIKDPAYLVTRTLEDFVTWVDNSKIKQHILEYNGLVIFTFFPFIADFMHLLFLLYTNAIIFYFPER